MAPEIVIAPTYGKEVDVFSFGIVLTELICCAPPRKRPMNQMYKFDEAAFKVMELMDNQKIGLKSFENNNNEKEKIINKINIEENFN